METNSPSKAQATFLSTNRQVIKNFVLTVDPKKHHSESQNIFIQLFKRDKCCNKWTLVQKRPRSDKVKSFSSISARLDNNDVSVEWMGERSDICADAAGYIWPPIYQTFGVREADQRPNQVNRELFTSKPPDYSSPVRTAQERRE